MFFPCKTRITTCTIQTLIDIIVVSSVVSCVYSCRIAGQGSFHVKGSEVLSKMGKMGSINCLVITRLHVRWTDLFTNTNKAYMLNTLRFRGHTCNALQEPSGLWQRISFFYGGAVNKWHALCYYIVSSTPLSMFKSKMGYHGNTCINCGPISCLTTLNLGLNYSTSASDHHASTLMQKCGFSEALVVNIANLRN